MTLHSKHNMPKFIAATCIVGLLGTATVIADVGAGDDGGDDAVAEPPADDFVPPPEEVPEENEFGDDAAAGDDAGAVDDGTDAYADDGGDAGAEADDGADDGADAYADDGGDDGGFDGGAPDAAEEEEDADEDEDVMAPDAEPDMEDGTAAAADPAALEALGYTGTQGVDYVPGEVTEAMVEDVGAGTFTATAEECAEACDANPSCNAASYYTANFPGGGSNNCYLKAINPGCAVPGDATANPDAWLLLSNTKCEVAAGPAMAPAVAPAASTGMYTPYPGKDYIPAGAGEPARAVTVEDIPGAGVTVATQAECEAECDANPACNAASYYTDAAELGGKNCWIKTLGDACMLPPDAADDPNATLLLKCGAGAPVAAPAAAPTADPFAAVPSGDTFQAPGDGGEAPLETATATRATGAGDNTTVNAPSSAISVRSAAAALVVAGGIAALI